MKACWEEASAFSCCFSTIGSDTPVGQAPGLFLDLIELEAERRQVLIGTSGVTRLPKQPLVSEYTGSSSEPFPIYVIHAVRIPWFAVGFALISETQGLEPVCGLEVDPPRRAVDISTNVLGDEVTHRSDPVLEVVIIEHDAVLQQLKLTDAHVIDEA